MRHGLAVGMLLEIGVAAVDPFSAAPPPPPPPGAIERAEAILHMPREGDLTSYLGRFSNDVTLTEGRTVIVQGRDQLLQYLQKRQHLTITVLDASYGNPIMASESVSNMPDFASPGVVVDCCFWARVATYHLNEASLVDRIEFIENGATWRPADRPR